MQITCPKCGKKLQIPPRLLGKKGKCPGCAFVVEFPQASSAQDMEAAPVEPRPQRVGEKVISGVIAVAFHLLVLGLIALLAIDSTRGEEGAPGQSVKVAELPGEQLITSEEQTFDSPSVSSDSSSSDTFSTTIDVPATPTSLDASDITIPSAPGGSSGGGGAGGLEFGGGSGRGSNLGGAATFMGTSAKGSRFCIIADHSGSMSGLPLEYVKTEILKTLSDLRGSARFAVIFFDHTATPMPVRPWLRRKDVPRIAPWVKSIAARGGTEPTPAFKLAFAINPRPDVIFFMTDGAFGQHVPATVNTLNKAMRGKKVVIHTISFLNRGGEALLRQIAADSEGTYRHVAGFMGRP